jgi:hypothetical protein
MRHVATILPSALSLFTPVNRALRAHPSTISLSASGGVRAALLDLQQLVTTLAARPTHVREILLRMTPITLDTVMPVHLERAAYGSVGQVPYPKPSGNCNGRWISQRRPSFLRATRPGRKQIQTWRWRLWCCI